ncbi:MAG: SIMPL domain-containing protein [Verrucomicrobiota bacterium]
MVTTRSFGLLGTLLAGGLAIFGLLIGRAVQRGREFDRFLTVRGLSEREVKATVALWPLRFSVMAEDLPALKVEMEKSRETVQAFFRAQNIAAEDVSVGLPSVQDRADREYGDAPATGLPRYKAIVTLVVRSSAVDVVKRAIQNVDQLLEQGIRLTGNEHELRPYFLFDGVNAIKPSMIEEATGNARAAAQKFALDSKATVGSIRRATQGALEIDDLDIASPERKVVRVVTTVEFFLQ